MTDETPETPPIKYPHGKHPNSTANQKRFGTPDANPASQDAGGNKPWSVRNSVRYMATKEIDTEDANSIKKIMPKKCTLATYIAMKTLSKAASGDMRAVEYVTDQIDGKLAQTNINAGLSEIMEMSDDELRAIARSADSAAEGGGGGAGIAAPGEEAGNASGEEQP